MNRSQVQETIKSIRSLVANDELDQAIDQLVEFTSTYKEDEYHDEALAVSADYKSLVKDIRKQIISVERKTLRRSQVMDRLLGILQEMEDYIDEPVKPADDDTTEKKKSSPIALWISLGVVGLCCVIVFSLTRKSNNSSGQQEKQKKEITTNKQTSPVTDKVVNEKSYEEETKTAPTKENVPSELFLYGGRVVVNKDMIASRSKARLMVDAIRGREDVNVFITPVIRDLSVLNPGPISSEYNGREWSIHLSDLRKMEPGMAFNVLAIDNDSPNSFRLSMNSENTVKNKTRLPKEWSDKSHQLIVTSYENIQGRNPSPIGVQFIRDYWHIINEDRMNIPRYAAFNVMIAPKSRVFLHRADRENTAGPITYIDHPKTNGHRERLLFITLNHGQRSNVNDNTFGVHYDEGKNQWAIVNQQSKNIPQGLSFNVLVANQFDQ